MFARMNELSNSFILNLVMIVLTVCSVFAEKNSSENMKLGSKMKFEGVLDIGLGYNESGYTLFNDNNNVWQSAYEKQIEVELDLEVDITGKITAEIDIEGEYARPGPKLQKGFVCFDLPEKQKLRIGNMKRRLGMEERSGRSERLAPGRSILHDYLSTFGFMGYNPAFEYQKKYILNENRSIKTWAQLGGNGDLKIFGELASDMSIGNLTCGGGVFYMQHFISRRENTLIVWLNTSWSGGRSRFEIELHAGKDPLASYYAQQLDSKPDICFSGTRLEAARSFVTGNKVLHTIQPILRIAEVTPDIKSPEEADVEFTPALSLFIGSSGRVRWKSGVSVLCTAGRPNNHVFHVKEYQVNTLLQVIW